MESINSQQYDLHFLLRTDFSVTCSPRMILYKNILRFISQYKPNKLLRYQNLIKMTAKHITLSFFLSLSLSLSPHATHNTLGVASHTVSHLDWLEFVPQKLLSHADSTILNTISKNAVSPPNTLKLPLTKP